MATTTGTLILLVCTMLAVNVALAFVQDGMLEANAGSSTFFNVSASPYAQYIVNGSIAVDDSFLPTDEAVEGDASGNIFSDTYKDIKGWMQKTLAPLNFASNILKQPYGFLRDVGLPSSVAVAFGVFWYLIALVIIVAWWTGR